MEPSVIASRWIDGTDELDLGNLGDVIDYVSRSIRASSKQGASPVEWRDSQAMCVVEEAGEFIGEYRRLKGFARRAGNREHMLEELADVVISALVMFENLDVDAAAAIEKKLRVIVTRGYVNKTPDLCDEAVND
jgi:NTP pyrophosphatase (non-canonical NTP hydrolase)